METFFLNRKDLPVSHGAQIRGLWRDAGEIADFRSHPFLAGALPLDLALSLVNLGAQSLLPEHIHSVGSCVAVLEGKVNFLSMGKAQLLQAGDVVQIPAGVPHGFSRASGPVFSGLAWQHTSRALFDNAEHAGLTYFLDEELPPSLLSRVPCQVFSAMGTVFRHENVGFESIRVNGGEEVRRNDEVSKQLILLSEGAGTLRGRQLRAGDMACLEGAGAEPFFYQSDLEGSLLHRLTFEKIAG